MQMQTHQAMQRPPSQTWPAVMKCFISLAYCKWYMLVVRTLGPLAVYNVHVTHDDKPTGVRLAHSVTIHFVCKWYLIKTVYFLKRIVLQITELDYALLGGHCTAWWVCSASYFLMAKMSVLLTEIHSGVVHVQVVPNYVRLFKEVALLCILSLKMAAAACLYTNKGLPMIPGVYNRIP